ncbi:MAG: GNAT family N-acetyltransferase, partial [Nanoarchaeota archaeon]
SSKETAFLCKDENDSIAFINLSIRSDYVQGSNTRPVGYVEGIYVNPKYRKKGIAKELIKIAEQWSLKNGCKELGSDAELENIDSQNFHRNLGFKEVNKTINFIKVIDNGLGSSHKSL